MNDTDRVSFVQAFTGVAIALREKEPDTAQLRVYFEALKAFPIELVHLAALDLAQTAKYFPKTSEWRDAIIAVEHRQRQEQQERLRKLHLAGQYLCAACDDTGMSPDASGRFGRCSCQDLRRREVLGLRPMPEPPAQLPTGDPAQVERGLAMARAAVKGIA